jgi:membrane protein implicated in regulation of membrane protease activity
MKLKTNSWHYKVWASTFNSLEPPPSSIDLCRYCHRIFWCVAIFTLLAVLTAACVGVLLWTFIYQGLVLHTVPTLIIIGVIAVIVGVVALYGRWLYGERKHAEPPKTLVGKYAHAVKQGVCPLVEFETNGDD